nr:acetylcholinesterase-like [Lytechinus pictus]
MIFKIVFSVPLLLSIILLYVESRGTPFVETKNGRILGRTIEVTPWQLPEDETIAVEAYTKIPYAEPPVEELRYKHPVKKVWMGELDATRPNVACPQLPYNGFTVEMEETEDCLYLDVFVPTPRPISAAVLVWIHGGGLQAGAGSVPEQLPIPLAYFGEVVVVTFNYRLGMFGFLNTGDGEIPANLGMFDQREALIWVQENIVAFGGDPLRVTIFGESAGGASVNQHLVSPLSTGLFNGAILQSGNALLESGLDTNLVDKTFKFGKGVGCDVNNSKDLVACLRRKSWEELRNGYLKLFPDMVDKRVGCIVDGHFLPDEPVNLMLKGHLIIIIGKKGDIFLKLADVFTDFFTCSENAFSSLMSTAGKTVYNYNMTHIPSHSALGPLKWAGATHVEDIPYVFGSPLLRGREEGPKGMSGFFNGAEEAGLSRQIMRYWSNFAKSGDPNLSSKDPKVVNNPLGLEDWQPFTNEHPYYKELNHGFHTTEDVMKVKECHFWTQILPKMIIQSFEMLNLKKMLTDQVAEQSSGTCDGDSCLEP